MTELILKEEVYAIVGAAIEVHRELGPGFFEAVYQEAMEIELREQGIPFNAQKPMRISYKGVNLRKEYIADLFCFDQVIVELKALVSLSGWFFQQLPKLLEDLGFNGDQHSSAVTVGVGIKGGSGHCKDNTIA